MFRKPLKFSSVALFLLVILLSLLLSRMEERRQQTMAQDVGVPVLMYHHLLPKNTTSLYRNNEIVTFTEDFEAQMRWLRDNGFESISPAAFTNWYEDGVPLPEKPVMITFDDGYMSNFTYAYPILRQYGFSAVIFSVTGKIAEQPVNFSEHRIDMLDADSMHKGGDVFYYASHTHALHHLVGKHSALVASDGVSVAADLRESFLALSAFPSADTTLFAYPYGNYSDGVEDILKAAGVRFAFRAAAGTLTRNTPRYELPRYPVSHTVSMKTFQGYFKAYVNENN